MLYRVSCVLTVNNINILINVTQKLTYTNSAIRSIRIHFRYTYRFQGDIKFNENIIQYIPQI
jgi:hypothetical protein